MSNGMACSGAEFPQEAWKTVLSPPYQTLKGTISVVMAGTSIAYRGGQVYGIDKLGLENGNPGQKLVTGGNYGCYSDGEHSNQLG